MSPREIRATAKLSLEKAAVAAGVTSPTLRLYEYAPTALRADKRAALDAFYASLAAKLAGGTPPPPPGAPAAAVAA
jgi:hypothetical protein